MTTNIRAKRWVWTALFILVLLAAGDKAAQAQSEGQEPGQTIGGAVYMPLVTLAAAESPGPPPSYSSVPIEGSATDRPAHEHADLNLALRGYTPTQASLALQDIDGPVDPNPSGPPQIAQMFSPARLPTFTSAYKVHDWNWSCGTVNGCQGEPLDRPAVSLLGMAVTPGEAIFFPTHGRRIYSGDYQVLVLYAAPDRITLKYTRNDNVRSGYTVHIEGLVVEPTLLELYNRLNVEGRSRLPALRAGERVGWAGAGEIKLAIRDTGAFMDPRARKDWWMGY